MDCFQNHRAHNLQTLGADFVDSILWSVPEDVVVAVTKVDEVAARHTALFERNVIVSDLVGAREEVRLIPQTSRTLVYNALNPRGPVPIAIPSELRISSHIPPH